VAAAGDDLRIREQFIDHIREVAQTERDEHAREIAFIHRDERRNSMFSYVFIAIAALLFSIAGYLMLFHREMTTMKTISFLFGVLSGAATALLKWQTNNLVAKRKGVEERQR